MSRSLIKVIYTSVFLVVPECSRTVWQLILAFDSVRGRSFICAVNNVGKYVISFWCIVCVRQHLGLPAVGRARGEP